LNNLFVLFRVEAWKPILTALLLPPVPLLLLVLIGARLMLPRRGWGWLLIVASVSVLWLSACEGAGRALQEHWLKPPPALTRERIAALRAQPKQPVAIVVLGSGMEPLAPEYGVSNLTRESVERLRYGLWLARETGWPVAYSGGAGWAQRDGPAEAQVAGRIAEQEFGRPLKWLEDQSRDTHENADRSIALLVPAGIQQIVLVTHGWHMPRALRNFEVAAQGRLRIEPAPMGLAPQTDAASLDWLPSGRGYTLTRYVLREALGRLLGA
jgi:uncharacterized SAM-binding protein YcdF (DUF218 family)